MLFEGVILGLIVGIFSRGKLKHIEQIQFKLWYLIVGAGILEFVFNIIRSREIEPFWQVIDQEVFWLKVLIYSLLIIALSVNIKIPGVIFAWIGTLLNGIVILINGGRMPVSIEGVEHLIKTVNIKRLEAGKDLAHILMTDDTKVPILADIIHIKPPYPLAKTVSLGDLFLCLGVAIFMWALLKGKVNQEIAKK